MDQAKRGEKRWSSERGPHKLQDKVKKPQKQNMAAARVLCAMALVAIAVVVDVGESVDDALE